MADPYLQPDGRTLRNRLGIVSDPARLQREETDRVMLREVELHVHGVPNARGFELVKVIHRHLFQDVYDWAGQIRTTSLTKLHHEGASARTTFTPPGDIERAGPAVFAMIERENGLRGLSPEALAAALPPGFSALNAVHPFREGNGRTQRLVWEHVVREARHELVFEGISKERLRRPRPSCVPKTIARIPRSPDAWRGLKSPRIRPGPSPSQRRLRSRNQGRGARAGIRAPDHDSVAASPPCPITDSRDYFPHVSSITRQTRMPA